MIQNLKNFASGLILLIGLILFFSSILNNNINLALVSLTSTLIFWVLYGLLLDTFDVKIFAWVISGAGFLLAISIFFIYAVEEVPHPIGAIIFHTGGIAGALGIGLFSLFPILIIKQINLNFKKTNPNISKSDNNTDQVPEINSQEWEVATENDIQNDQWEIK